MPTASPLIFGDAVVTPAADGRLSVSIADRVVARLGVRFPSRWTPEPVDVAEDGLSQRWRLDAVTAEVRHRIDHGWSLSIRLANAEAEPVTVPPCELILDAAWPALTWLAGAEGMIVLDAGLPDGRVLAFQQLRGHSRFARGRRWLAPMPLTLPASGVRQIAWRGEWRPNHGTLAASLPSWWPERTALREGEVLELPLPDAAVTAERLQLSDDGSSTTLIGHPGHYLAQVHTGTGTTDLELWWSRDLDTDLRRRSVRLLSGDPRTCGGATAWTVIRALGADAVDGRRDASEFAESAVECLVAGSRREPDPFAAAAIAEWALRTGDAELVGSASDSLAGSRGLAAVRAAARVRMAAVLLGVASTPPFPTDAEDPVERDLMAVELSLSAVATRRAEVPAAFWRVGTLLGAGLPGVVADPLTRAKAVSVLRQAPEWLDDTSHWAVLRAELVDQAIRRLIADECDNDTFAWLLL